MNCLLCYFLLKFVFFVTVSGFRESHFKRVFIKDFEITGYYDSISALSVCSCSKTCSESSICRSFSYRSSRDDDDNDDVDDKDNVNCYLYSTVAILTSSAISKTGFRYYWKLADSCPASYHQYPDLSLCLRVFSNGNKTVLEAEERCEQDGGHLVIIDTEERQKYLVEFYKQSNMTGVRSLVGGMELGNGTENWYWFNGAYVTNWFDNQPDNYNNIEDCLQAIFKSNITQFNDISCTTSQQFPYICEIPII